MYSWTSISTGTTHSLALRNDGALYVWGNNANGQLGIGDTVSRSSPVQLGTSSWASVSAGGDFSMAIRSDGVLYTWGFNTNYQLGVDDTIHRSNPVQIGPTSSVGVNLTGQTTVYQGFETSGYPTQIEIPSNTAYTVEVWLYLLSYGITSGIQPVWSVSNTASTAAQYNFLLVNGYLVITYGASTTVGTVAVQGTILAPLNQWFHAAWTRNSSGVWTLYINGVAGGSGTYNYNLSSTGTYAPATNHSFGQPEAGTYYFNGTNYPYYFASNFRICRGVQVYTGNFTVPTSPLTATQSSGTNISAITAGQCMLLTLQDSTLIDNSGNNLTLVANGASSAGSNGPLTFTTFNPFPNSNQQSWTVVSAGLSFSTGTTVDYKLFTWGNNTYSQLGDATTITRSRPVQILSNNSWSYVCAGGSHAVALTTDKKLYSWGRNESGQLGTGITNSWVPGNPLSGGGKNIDALTILDINGDLFTMGQPNIMYGNDFSGTVATVSSPVQIGVGKSYRYVAQAGAGGSTATIFVIDNNYKLWAWGDNTVGKLGDSSSVARRSSPVQIGSSSWSMVTNGFQNIFAIDAAGRLFSWGSGNNGLNGQNTLNISYSSPTQIGTSSWTTVATGTSAAYAIRSDGTMWGWGGAPFVGDGTTIAKSSPVQLGVGFSWSSVCATDTSALAIRSDGLLFGWGQNVGDLGLNDTISRSSPTQIGSDSWTSITTGTRHVIGLKSNGVYFAWGLNTSGQLGDGTGGPGQTKSSPVQVGYSYPTIIADGLTTRGYTADNRLFVWGANNLGQLGLNDAVYRSNPIQITGIKAQISPMLVGTSSWTNVSAGYSHTLGVTSDGKLFAWGANGNGQLGVIGSYLSVTQGINHKYILNSDNMLFSAGYNNEGQLGIASGTSSQNAVAASTVVQFSSVFAGSNAGYGIDFNKNLWAWGYNGSGALGDGTGALKNIPVYVGGSWNNISVTQWLDNVMNFPVAFGVTTDNKLFSWGQNFSGLRLTGNFYGSNNRSSPVQVGSDTNWDTVAPNFGQSLFMVAKKTDGSIYGWGRNEYGQLGFANTTLISWTQIEGSNQHTIGLQSNGTLWGWGTNAYGQLGVADTVSRNSPVQIDTNNSYIQITAGGFDLPMSLFIRTNKTLWATGYNVDGSIGDGTTINRSSPVQVAGSWNSVGVGYRGHVAAIASDGTLWGWGMNQDGGLANYAVGDGTSINRSSPVQISTSSFSSVYATGSNYTLAQATDGSLWGWGINTSGQLGVTYIPWTSISTGAYHTIGIRSNGTAWGWGSNAGGGAGGAGQLGINNAVTRSSPVQIGTDKSWSTAFAGLNSSFIIDNQYRLFATGTNTNGALGDGTTINRSSPVQVAGSWTNIIANGTWFTFGYKSDGTLWTWGSNSNGNLGDNTTISKSSPVQMATNYVKVAAGVSTAYGINSSGQLFSWGNNNFFALAAGDASYTINRSSPIQIGTTNSWTAVAAFRTGGLAIDVNQKLWTWGLNDYGQLGLGDTVNRSSPVQVGTDNWTEIYGSYESFAIGKKSNGTVWSWGMNLYGQLGDGTNASRSSPVQIGVGLSNIGTGLRFATFTRNGYTYMQGANDWGQLGGIYLINSTSVLQISTPVLLGNTLASTNIETPTQITSSSYSMISTGMDHVLALTSTGNLFTWGNGATQATLGPGPAPYSLLAGTFTTFLVRNDGKLFSTGYNVNNQLQIASGASSLTFVSPTVDIGTATSWRKLATASYANTIHGIRKDGTLWGWGDNSAGQIGVNTVIAQSSMTMIGGLLWNDVVNGQIHTLGLRDDNTLWTWGSNSLGQLGINLTTNRSSPVQIGTSSYIAIATRFTTSYAIRSDYTLWAWGFNGSGGIGDGTTINKSSPVQVTGSWNSVVAGLSHVVARKTDGTIWSWGSNTSGIGDGTSYARSSPVQVQTSVSFAQISAGDSFNMAITTNNELYMWGNTSFGQITTEGAGFSYTQIAAHSDAGYLLRDDVLFGASSASNRLWPLNTSMASPVMLAGNVKTIRALYSSNTGAASLFFIKYDGTAWASQGNSSGQVGDGTTVFRSSPTQVGTATDWADLGWYVTGDMQMLLKNDRRLFVAGANNFGQLGDNTVVAKSSPVQVPGSWITVSSGHETSYGIDSNNKLWAWGRNTYGALGQIVSGFSWTIYNSGPIETSIFAIDESKTLYAWGINGTGQLGDGTTINRSSAVQIGTSSWNMVSTNGNTNNLVSLGIRFGGSLFGWGANSYGQIGDNTRISKSSPVQIGTSSWSLVASGNSNGVAIDINNRLFAWGDDTYGQLGQNTRLAHRSSPVQVAGSWSTVHTVGAIMAGIKTDGTLWTWGSNSYGELGQNDLVSRSSPVQVGIATDWTKVYVASNTSLATGQIYAINSSNQLFVWGRGDSGALGNGTTTSRSNPVQIEGSWTTVEGTFGAAAGIRSDSTVWAWGYNGTAYRYGQAIAYSSPVQVGVSPRLSFTQIAMYIDNLLLLTPDQQLYVVGADGTKLFTPLGTTYSSPVQVATLGGRPLANTIHRSSPVQLGSQDWLDVRSGSSYAVALRSDYTLWTWGDNGAGQLGQRDVVYRSSPVQVFASATALSFIAISTASSTPVAIDTSYKLWSWGYNVGGGMGDNTVINKSSPTQIGTSSWTQVFSGLGQNFYIRSDGTMWGTGGGSNYALGMPVQDRSSPVQVWSGVTTDTISVPIPKLVSSARYVNVSAGGSHVIAVRPDGSTWTWGGNTYGQLGDNSVVSRSSPIQMGASAGLSWFFNSPSPRQVVGSWSSINAGFNYSSALDTVTSTVYAWGINTVGQLGDGTIANKSSPVQIGTPVTYSALFDGTSQYLRVGKTTVANLSPQNQSFTIEMFIYLTGTALNDMILYGVGLSIASSARYGLKLNSSNNVVFYSYYFDLTGTIPVTVNTWTHIAYVRNISTNTGSLYINGVLDGSTTDNYTYGTTGYCYVAYEPVSGIANYFPGYISNIRFVKGVAVYTGNFTVPTTQLATSQSAGTNISAVTAAQTTLLMLQSLSVTTDVTSGTYPSTITNYNGVSMLGTNPFGITGTMDRIYNTNIPSTNFTVKTNQLFATGSGLSYAQLGTTNTSVFTAVGTVFNTSYFSPTLISSESWKIIATGYSHTVAIKGDDTLWAWGYNLYGQLGNNSTVDRSSPVQIGTSSWSMIVAGLNLTAGLTVDGKIFTWGQNNASVLGNAGAVTRSSPVQIATDKSFVFLSGSGYSLNAIDTNNDLWTWGNNFYGQLGIGSTTTQAVPVRLIGAPVLVNRSSPVQVPSSTSVSWSLVSAGNNISSAIDNTSKLYTWGLNNSAQLGVGSNTAPSRSSPIQINSKSYSLVSAGQSQMLAYSNGNTPQSPQSLYGWGNNNFGQLGTNDTVSRFFANPILTTQLYFRNLTPAVGPVTSPATFSTNSPTQVGTSSWISVSGGENHTIGTITGNVLFTWGLNNSGQLGDSTLINKSSPVQITSNVIDVSAGSSHNAIENSNGTGYTFGLNSDGQLGDNT